MSERSTSDTGDAARWLATALGLGEDESPFPWQLRLLAQFRTGDIPRSLDVPTGLGKTATMAIWLVSRALGAEVPRRLVYVVDRRAVVDQATKVAEDLRDWVKGTPAVGKALGLVERPLPVSTLRGKFVDNREWLEDPSSPAIVVGTVDMVGSRLLFCGYRATRKVRPYLAGLLGADSLFVLDEAHLVPPFERLLERIVLDGRDLGPCDDVSAKPPPVRLLSLSATGRSRGGFPFDLDEADLKNRIVRQRLDADKRLSLRRLDHQDALATSAAERAWALSNGGARPVRCVVFLGKREDAEKAKSHLETLAGLDKPKKAQAPVADVELLVGGRRVYERASAATRLEQLGFLAGGAGPRERSAFLFATSAGEVGIDLDADHMVCDLVAWERMVQRLGRVNRRGFGNETEVIVLDPPSGEKSPLAVAERLDAVRALLARLPCHRDRPEARDASPGSLLTLYHAARKDPELAHTIERASTPDPLYPPLDRPTLEAWSMTSLPDDPGRPAVAPWLRGWVEDRPQTSITWRKYLPLTDGSRPRDSIAKRFFQAAPAHLSEVLETESTRVADWLGKRANKLRALDRKTAKDAVGLGDEDHVLVVHRRNDEAFDWFTLRRLDSLSRRELDRKLTAAEVFVDARFGGLSTSGMLDASCDGSPPTADDGAWDAAGFRVREVEDESPIEDPVWRERERFPRDKDDEGEVRRWLVVEKRLIETATEEDRSAGRPQPLSNHQQCAKKHADRIVEGLGLCPSMRRLLPIAARLHDEGKRAKRWQAAFRAPKDGRPFAKTLGPVNPHLLDGYRHEFGSLPYAERDPEVAALPSEDRDLVLHLIACHHGYARPVISTGGCDDAPPSALRERARDVALRFAWLQARWGPWGLAYWEALLRASDQGASRENDRADTRGRAEKA